MILARSLAETFAFYTVAQIFHWNVTGPDFPQYHRLFGDIYTDAFGAIDALAEHIRAAGEMAPATLDGLLRPSRIRPPSATTAADMLSQLIDANERVLSALHSDLSTCTDPGIENFLEARMDTHSKWRWMLTATAGQRQAEPKEVAA